MSIRHKYSDRKRRRWKKMRTENHVGVCRNKNCSLKSERTIPGEMSSRLAAHNVRLRGIPKEDSMHNAKMRYVKSQKAKRYMISALLLKEVEVRARELRKELASQIKMSAQHYKLSPFYETLNSEMNSMMGIIVGKQKNIQ